MTAPTIAYWIGTLVWISLGVAAIVGAAWLAERIVVAARWRRLAWQAAACATILLVVWEVTGVTQGVAGWGASIAASPTDGTDARRASEHGATNARASAAVAATPLRDDGLPVGSPPDSEAAEVRVRNDGCDAKGDALPARVPGAAGVGDVAHEDHERSARLDARVADASRRSSRIALDGSEVERAAWLSTFDRSSSWWPASVWLAGCLVVWFRIVLDHVRLARVVRRCRVVTNARVVARVDRVARRIGLRAKPRLVEWPGACSPVACGWRRGTLGLSSDFESRFDPGQQDAVLAHELAHLRAADPLWHAVMDFVVGLLWWQPLVRVLRCKLRAASEAAADEASLVVEQGPRRLAESLLLVGRDHAGGPWAAAARADGGPYRSSLGRRVDHLLSLRAARWRPPSRVPAWTARVVVPLIAIGLIAFVGGGARAWLAIGDPPASESSSRAHVELGEWSTGDPTHLVQGDVPMKLSEAVRRSILGSALAFAFTQSGAATEPAGSAATDPAADVSSITEPPVAAITPNLATDPPTDLGATSAAVRPANRSTDSPTDPPADAKRVAEPPAERRAVADLQPGPAPPVADPMHAKNRAETSATAPSTSTAASSIPEHVVIVARFALADIPENAELRMTGGVTLQTGVGGGSLHADAVNMKFGDSSGVATLEMSGGVRLDSGPRHPLLLSCARPTEATLEGVRALTADSEYVRYFALPLASGQYGDIVFSNQTAYIREFEVERNATTFVVDPVVDVLETGMLFSAIAHVEDDGKIRLGVDIDFSHLDELEERHVDLEGATMPVTVQEPKVTSGRWSVERVVEDGGRTLLVLAGFEPDRERSAIFVELVVRHQKGPRDRISIDANRD